MGDYIIRKSFILRTIFVLITMSILSSIIPTDIILINNKLINVLISATLMGVGLGIIINVGGSTGGTDIISYKFSGAKFSFAQINAGINLIIVAIAYFINKDILTIVYMVVLVYTWGYVLDKSIQKLKIKI